MSFFYGGLVTAGGFEGSSDIELILFENISPVPERKGHGIQHTKTTYKGELQTLLTLKFQTFNKAQK